MGKKSVGSARERKAENELAGKAASESHQALCNLMIPSQQIILSQTSFHFLISVMQEESISLSPEGWLSVFFGIEPACQADEINNPCLVTVYDGDNHGVVRCRIVSD